MVDAIAAVEAEDTPMPPVTELKLVTPLVTHGGSLTKISIREPKARDLAALKVSPSERTGNSRLRTCGFTHSGLRLLNLPHLVAKHRIVGEHVHVIEKVAFADLHRLPSLEVRCPVSR